MKEHALRALELIFLAAGLLGLALFVVFVIGSCLPETTEEKREAHEAKEAGVTP